MPQHPGLNRRAGVVIALLVTLSALLLCRLSGMATGLELRLYDWRVRLSARTQAASGVVIGGVDDRTMSELETWGPNALSRRYYADMVRRLSRAGALAIGLDVTMGASSEHDDELARAIDRFGKVVLTAEAEATVAPSGRAEEYSFTDPALPLAQASRLVASPLLPRPDNVVRYFETWQASGDGARLYPAFATALAQVYGPSSPGSVEGAGSYDANPSRQVWIHWVKPEALTVIPALYIVKGDFDRGAVEGKIVLIGRWDAAEDHLQTPLGPMPGVAVHAQAANTLLGGSRLQRLPLVTAALAFLICVGIAWAAARIRASYVALLTAGAMALVIGVALVAFRWAGIWIGMVQTIAAIIATGMVVAAVQSEAARPWVPAWLAAKPQHVTATVLVCDIRGYTARAEAEGAARVMAVLERFFDVVERAVAPHGGFTGRRPGDAAIVLFRDARSARGVKAPNHADRALRAALDVRIALAGLAAECRARGQQPLSAGTTLVTGEMSIGVLGTSHKELQFVGDPLNVAFRLQEFARERQCDLVIAGSTAATLTGASELRPLGSTQVRGRQAPVELYTVDLPGAPRPDDPSTATASR